MKPIVVLSLFDGARVVGRKIDENGKRQDYSDLPINQRLELRNDEKAGCITSVTKDSVFAYSGILLDGLTNGKN